MYHISIKINITWHFGNLNHYITLHLFNSITCLCSLSKPLCQFNIFIHNNFNYTSKDAQYKTKKYPSTLMCHLAVVHVPPDNAYKYGFCLDCPAPVRILNPKSTIPACVLA